MATDDRQVLVAGTAPAPALFTVPGNGQISPKVVFAHYDGTSAAGTYQPTLKIISDGGEVVAICPIGSSLAAGVSADVSWFLGAELEEPTSGTGAGVIVESLFLTTPVGSITSATTLQSGREYVITVQGTYSKWNLALGAGSPQADAMFPSSVAGRVSTQVGLDAECEFAHPAGPGTIGHVTIFEMNLGSGFAHVEPVGGPFGAPQPNFFYTYNVTGQGATATFRVNDAPLADNYGKLLITIQTVGGGSSGGGEGSLLPDPSQQPNGAWLRTSSGAAAWFATPQVAETDMTLSDVTTQNVSTSKHGFAPKAPNDSTKFLDGTGAYSVPAASGVSSFNARSGAVVPGNADYLAVASGGLTGATAATRFVGGTASGHPVAGTFAVGDFVVDQTGTSWVCTVAGTPGTWVSPAAGSGLPGGGATSQVVGYGGSPGTGVWVYPPGFEIAYAQITTNANITDTNEATATSLISPGAVTFDGGPVLLTVFLPEVLAPTGAASNTVTFTLFEGSTEITRLGVLRALVVTTQNVEIVTMHYRFTPTAASHTYKLCAVVPNTTGTPAIVAGSGGTGGAPPAFMRFTKV